VRILLVGDTHRNSTFLASAFAAAKRNECELIVQLGDFGFGWQWLPLTDTLAVCKFSAIASMLVEKTGIGLRFIDGNHENFDKLSLLPVGETGMREVAPGVFHLPRGMRFEIDGASFLALGGATSLDRLARTPSVSWWEAEAITTRDVEACGSETVDVLLTHDMPLQCGLRSDRAQSGFGIKADMDWYLNRLRVAEVVETVRPKWVFHGHLHHRYERDLRPELATTVLGLASDKSPLGLSSVVFDTQVQTIHLTEVEG